jgi:hypothetical protein
VAGLIILIIPSVVAVLVIMSALTRVNRSAPQAYYLKKQRDVSILFGQTDPVPNRRDEGEYTLL